MEGYFHRLAAAFVRGQQAPVVPLPPELQAPDLSDLDDQACLRICERGRAAGLRIHAFKQATQLPRVRKVLGILRGTAPGSVLDIGAGRGVFLWPLLHGFPALDVVAVDRLPDRVRRLQAVRRGGVSRLAALRTDALALCLGDGSVDVVTLLEVLEHVSKPRRALEEALRVARRFVVLSVPSKEDDNPEHLHLFTKDLLETLLVEAGAGRVSVEYVLNHMVVVARCR